MNQIIEMNPAAAFVRKALREALWSIRYHEQELHKAHQKLAQVKAVIERGSYTEFTIAEVQAELDHKNEDDDD